MSKTPECSEFIIEGLRRLRPKKAAHVQGYSGCKLSKLFALVDVSPYSIDEYQKSLRHIIKYGVVLMYCRRLIKDLCHEDYILAVDHVPESFLFNEDGFETEDIRYVNLKLFIVEDGLPKSVIQTQAKQSSAAMKKMSQDIIDKLQKRER